MRSEGFYVNKKKPMTPAGIEQSTFRFVAQNHNHCATAVCQVSKYVGVNIEVLLLDEVAGFSLHFTSLRFASLHFTSLHFTSLHFTSLYFTSLHCAINVYLLLRKERKSTGTPIGSFRCVGTTIPTGRAGVRCRVAAKCFAFLRNVQALV